MKREKTIVIRISQEEENKIKKQAEKMGLPKSTYLRVKVLEIINAES